MTKPTRIARTVVRGYVVSTVRLPMDHNYSGVGPPLLYESMLFPNEAAFRELAMDRYSTRMEAEVGHWNMVAQVENGTLP